MSGCPKSLKETDNAQRSGGCVCSCPIKYEKLPLICFYCGKLGHGTNECKDVFGDQSPVKHYGAWLKASPWKPLRAEDEMEDDGVEKKSGKKLFFAKKTYSHNDTLKVSASIIHSVTSLLGKVVLEDETVGHKDSLHGTISQVREDEQQDLVVANKVDQGGDYGGST